VHEQIHLRFGRVRANGPASHYFERHSRPRRSEGSYPQIGNGSQTAVEIRSDPAKPPDSLLLPINLSKCPLEVFSYVNQFAASHSTVILLHVVQLNILPPEGRIIDELSCSAHRHLERLAAKFLDKRLVVCIRVRLGKAAHEILNEARESNANLIVLTSHGSDSLWKRALQPKVVEKVLRAAPCDVRLLHARTRFNCEEDWDCVDEFVSAMEYTGLFRPPAKSLT
jgi:nucleotide-binding universal stress UspA family protein